MQRQHICCVCFGSLFCEANLSTNAFILCFMCQKYQKQFNRKIDLKKNLTLKTDSFDKDMLSENRKHLSLNNYFAPLLKLLESAKSELKRKIWGTSKNYDKLVKSPQVMDNLFLKKLIEKDDEVNWPSRAKPKAGI